MATLNVALPSAVATKLDAGSGIATRNTIAFVGDSNTANPGATDQTGPFTTNTNNVPSWATMLVQLSGGVLEHAGTWATAGGTVESVTSAKMASILAMDPAPGACLIVLGSNNVTLGTSSDGTGFDLAATTTVFETTIASLKARGILPIVGLATPHGSDLSLVQRNQSVWQRRLRALAAKHRVPMVDLFRTAMDPTTGHIPAGMQQDALHVNAAGRLAIAEGLIKQGILDYFPPARIATCINPIDPTNLLSSGKGLFSSLTGWTAYGTGATWSVVAPTADDRLSGQWLQGVSEVAAANNRQSTTDTPTAGQFDVGDTIELTCRYQTDGFAAAKAAGLSPSFYVRLAFKNSSGTEIGYASAHSATPAWDVDIKDGLARAYNTVPSGADRFHVSAFITGSGTGTPIRLRVGEITVRNLTKLAGGL